MDFFLLILYSPIVLEWIAPVNYNCPYDNPETNLIVRFFVNRAPDLEERGSCKYSI